jgi:hypothetical protein
VDGRGLESEFSNEISYSVPATPGTGNPSNPAGPTNTSPNISILAGQTLDVDTATGPLSFTVGDTETPAAELTLLANSSNPALVPNTNIVLSGTGINRTVIVTPAAGQVGTSLIALTVCDTSLCATASFLLTVNPLPTVTLSSPASGTTFSAPALLNFAASVSANNHSITKVRFFNGTTFLGEAAAAPYTFSWNNVQAGSYSLAAQAVYDAGSTVTSLPANVAVLGLCPPWETADIGSTPMPGTATISDGVYTVRGAGNIGASTDSFRFLYQPLSGDGEILLQIASVQNTGNNGCVGAMIRESLTSKSRYAFISISPSGAFRWQCRNKTGAGTSTTKAGTGTPPSTWSRLVRSGNTLSGYKSTDGTKWTLVNSSTISMARTSGWASPSLPGVPI